MKYTITHDTKQRIAGTIAILGLFITVLLSLFVEPKQDSIIALYPVTRIILAIFFGTFFFIVTAVCFKES